MNQRTALPAVAMTAALILVLLSGCDFFEELFGKELTPDIPEPESYLAEVPLRSEELILETVPLTNFVPWVTEAADDEGVLLDVPDGYVQLVQNGNPVAAPTSGVASPPIENVPYIQFVRYWQRVGKVERYSGATTTTIERVTSKGTVDTEAYSFGVTVGVSTTVSMDAIFASASLTVSAEFSAEYSSEVEISTTEEVRKTYEVAAEQDENLVFCVWQLVNDYRIVYDDGDGDDDTWAEYEDPGFVFDPACLESLTVPTNELRNMSYTFPNTARALDPAAGN